MSNNLPILFANFSSNKQQATLSTLMQTPQRLLCDYVVIGAGASGSVLAAKLAKTLKSDKILVLEGGGTNDLTYIRDFRESLYIPPTELSKKEWGYTGEVQTYMHDRVLGVLRAKMLGGCSSINQCLYVHGSPADFDLHWPKNWSYKNVLPNYKNLETVQDPELKDSKYRGNSGPLKISNFQSKKNALAHKFFKAAVKSGYSPIDDYNKPFEQKQVCSWMQFNVTKDHVRQDAFNTFLAPIKEHENLEIITDATVTKVLFKNDFGFAPIATGVQFVRHGKTYIVDAKEEVILCGGSIGSCHLLQLSGIGDAKLLSSVGVPVVRDLPGVGQNLQDHLITFCLYKLKEPLPEEHTNLIDVNMFVKADDGRYPLQMYNICFPKEVAALRAPANSFGAESILDVPFSTGYVLIQSSDYKVQPKINHNFLKDKRDLAIIIDGIRRIRKIYEQIDFVGEEIGPGKDRQTDEEIAEYIRDVAFPIFHPCCTCKMTEKFDYKTSVVDAQARVWGVQRLRVADAGIMPEIVSGNTHAACMMIGDKVAEMIIQGRKDATLKSSM